MSVDAAMALSLVPGDGFVFREGAIIAVVLRDENAEPDEVGALLHAVREAGSPGNDSPGASLARTVGDLLHDDPQGYPAFAVVAPTHSEVMVLLHGDLELVARAQGNEVTESGRGAPTWVERRLPAPVDALRVFPTGHGGGADLWTDLREGTAHGVGFHLRHVGVRAGRTAEADAERTPVEFESYPLVGPDAMATGERRPPLPVVGRTSEPEPAPTGKVIVKGIRCARDHHNNPEALYCSRCGIKMVHRTHVLVDGERPPLGVITFEDGTTYPVDRDLVIGREPRQSERVADDEAEGVQVDDDRRAVSRTHLAIELDGWDVYAVDLDSANGTFLRPPRSDEWTRLEANERRRLETGATIRIGGREFVFDQHHV